MLCARDGRLSAWEGETRHYAVTLDARLALNDLVVSPDGAAVAMALVGGGAAVLVARDGRWAALRARDGVRIVDAAAEL